MTGTASPAPVVPSIDALAADLTRLRGDRARPPDLSVVVPVSARDDLDRVRALLADLCRYRGRRTLEIVTVVNRYPAEAPPAAIADLGAAGLTVVATPDAFHPGEVVCFSARMLGVRAAGSDRVVSLDADCRVPDPTRLLDWYADQLDAGATAAYTAIRYHELRPLVSVRARLATHHGSRWVKRVVLRIPTLRGGNFAIRRAVLIGLHDERTVGDELSIGPVVRARGARIAYSGNRRVAVLTSGRWMRGGWARLARYLVYRVRYNVRALRTSDAAVAARRRLLHQENLR